MTTARLTLEGLPFWPRFLTREEAARYVGVSASTFDEEVSAGSWPQPQRRGAKGGRVTWDRVLLDQWADRMAGLDIAPPPAPIVPVERGWQESISGTTTIKHADPRRQKAAGGR